MAVEAAVEAAAEEEVAAEEVVAVEAAVGEEVDVVVVVEVVVAVDRAAALITPVSMLNNCHQEGQLSCLYRILPRIIWSLRPPF